VQRAEGMCQIVIELSPDGLVRLQTLLRPSAWQAQSGTACTRLSILRFEHVCHLSVTFPDLV